MNEEEYKEEQEDFAYKKLRKMGLEVEMSEGYIPIDCRVYEVYVLMNSRECIFKGGFDDFIKFAKELRVIDLFIYKKNMKGGIK